MTKVTRSEIPIVLPMVSCWVAGGIVIDRCNIDQCTVETQADITRNISGEVLEQF